MATEINPPLSEDEKQTPERMVAAVVTRDMATIRSFPKSEVYREEVFVEWLDYAHVGLNDMPDDLFSDVLVMSSPNYEFDLLSIKLRDHGKATNRVELSVQRDKVDGTLRLNSIGDIEPEDQWTN